MIAKTSEKKIETTASNCTRKTLQDFNNVHHGSEFWKNFEKIFSNEKDTMAAPLNCKNGLRFKATETADVSWNSCILSAEFIWLQKISTKSYSKWRINKLNSFTGSCKNKDGIRHGIIKHKMSSCTNLITSLPNCTTQHVVLTQLTFTPKICTCLVNLFNCCRTNSQGPWTESPVLFLKKPSKPDYTDPSAFRPLCKSSHSCKVIQLVLNNRVKLFLMNNILIDHEQAGFWPKNSTTRSISRLKIENEVLTIDGK